jgi:hypothetical protein
VTAHPAAEWTTQQFREFLMFDHPYRFVIHDRDAIFSSGLDAALKGFGVRVLWIPFRAPRRIPIANDSSEPSGGSASTSSSFYRRPI